MHFVKLPNFLSIESRPFDPETYEDELDDENANQQDEEGRQEFSFVLLDMRLQRNKKRLGSNLAQTALKLKTCK